MTTTRSTDTTAPPVVNHDLAYTLDDTPALDLAIFAARHHLLASFAPITTPTPVTCSVLSLAHIGSLGSGLLHLHARASNRSNLSTVKSLTDSPTCTCGLTRARET